MIGPVRGNLPEGDHACSERKGGRDYHEAHRLVHDHGLQGGKSEWADQERKSELSPTEANQPPEGSNDRASPERG